MQEGRIRVMDRENENAGFTLVELVVALAVASIVMLAAFGLMQLGMRQYASGKRNTDLQYAVSTALAQIDETAVDTSAGAVVSEDGKTLVLLDGDPRAAAKNHGGLTYRVYTYDAAAKELLYAEIPSVSFGTREINDSGTQTGLRSEVLNSSESDRHVLAENVTSVSFEKFDQKAVALSDQGNTVNLVGGIRVKIAMEDGNKSISEEQKTAFRNRVLTGDTVNGCESAIQQYYTKTP